MRINTNAKIIKNMKPAKYSLEEANEIIKNNAQKFPGPARIEYCSYSGVPYSTMLRYMKGVVPSKIAANDLAQYIEAYVNKNSIAA